MNRPSRKHPSRRKLAELPYQQLHTKQWEDLETTFPADMVPDGPQAKAAPSRRCFREIAALKLLLLILFIGLAWGCGNKSAPSQNEDPGFVDRNANDNRPPESIVAGEYKATISSNRIKSILLANGAAEYYRNEVKDETKGKWSLVNGELHIHAGDSTAVFQVSLGESKLLVSEIDRSGIRVNFAKTNQVFFTKVK